MSKREFRGREDRVRYMREIQSVACLAEHPNVVKYFRSWQQDSHFYIQMELCEAGNLRTLLDSLSEPLLESQASTCAPFCSKSFRALWACRCVFSFNWVLEYTMLLTLIADNLNITVNICSHLILGGCKFSYSWWAYGNFLSLIKNVKKGTIAGLEVHRTSGSRLGPHS